MKNKIIRKEEIKDLFLADMLKDVKIQKKFTDQRQLMSLARMLERKKL